MMQAYQAIEIVYDIALHAIYATRTDAQGSGGLTGTTWPRATLP
jgi:hypothetical protein